MNNLKSKEIAIFTFLKYFSYIGLFVRGIMIAKILGPSLLGGWGILMLIIQYLSYSNFGVQYAFTKGLATFEKEDFSNKSIFVNSIFSLTLIFSIVIILITLVAYLFFFSALQYYDINNYLWMITIYIVMHHFQQLYVNYFREESKFFITAISEILIAFLPIISLFFFDKHVVTYLLLFSFIVSKFLSILLFAINIRYTIKLTLNIINYKKIIITGIPLMLYNFSYYLISMSAKTIVGFNNDSVTMGFYHISVNISNSVLLGINTISWILFPKLLRSFKHCDDSNDKVELIHKTILEYNTIVHIILLIIIVFVPILYLILPQYSDSLVILSLFLVSQAILSQVFVFTSYLIANNKIIQLSLITLMNVFIVWVMSYFFINKNYPDHFVAFSVFIATFTFHVMITLYTEFQIYGEVNLKFIKKFFLQDISLIFFTIIVMIDYSTLYLVSILILYLLLSKKEIKNAITSIMNNYLTKSN